MSNTKKRMIKDKRERRAITKAKHKSRNNQLLELEEKNMSNTYKTQALKQAAIDAQQIVVNNAAPADLAEAKEDLAEIKAKEVVA